MLKVKTLPHCQGSTKVVLRCLLRMMWGVKRWSLERVSYFRNTGGGGRRQGRSSVLPWDELIRAAPGRWAMRETPCGAGLLFILRGGTETNASTPSGRKKMCRDISHPSSREPGLSVPEKI